MQETPQDRTGDFYTKMRQQTAGIREFKEPGGETNEWQTAGLMNG